MPLGAQGWDLATKDYSWAWSPTEFSLLDLKFAWDQRPLDFLQFFPFRMRISTLCLSHHCLGSRQLVFWFHESLNGEEFPPGSSIFRVPSIPDLNGSGDDSEDFLN